LRAFSKGLQNGHKTERCVQVKKPELP